MELKPRILVVEDESIIAMDLRVTLLKLGYIVTSVVNNALLAIQKVEQDKPDLILMDIMLGGSLDGIEAAKIISYQHPTPIIYITALENEETIRRASLPDPFLFLMKPYTEKDLKHAIEVILKYR
ncbi:MAG: response regulator [Ignavibacteriaceae bacterium]|nr:response regulator [Ignavibacteriaceae bacterium]